MTFKFDTVTIVQLREKDYENGKVYFASVWENGYTNSVTCTKDFYDKHKEECRLKPITLNGCLAEVKWFKGVAKIKLI